MKDRIKEIRKKSKLTQTDFAENLGVSASNIQSYELGRRTPSDAFIKLICNKYSVNEVWLRSGEGEPYEISDVDKLVLEAKEALKDDDPVYRDEFIELIKTMDAGTMRVWYNYAKTWVDNVEKKKPPT